VPFARVHSPIVRADLVTNLLLGLHLLGAVCFFVGAVVAGDAQLRAIRQERPSEVYACLRRARLGAALVGTGALLTLGFGIALAQHEGIGLGPMWIQVSLALWVAAMALGAYGGRTARHARHLAQTLAAQGDAPSPKLRALVSARGPLWGSYASFALLIVIVVLMVWQPGGSNATHAADFPTTLQAQIVRATPQLAYLPTRVPAGVDYSRYTPDYPSKSHGFRLTFTGAGGQDEFAFSAIQTQCTLPDKEAPTYGTLTANGYRIGWDVAAGLESAWRCVTHDHVQILLQAQALEPAVGRADLVTLVAYAEPFTKPAR